MLELPSEYITTLEEVLNQPLSGQALVERKGKAFIEGVARGVAKISQGLTKDRTEFIASHYLNNTQLQSAYLTYYTSTNLLKIWPLMRELAAGGFLAGRESIAHLDLGTGIGAAVWGLSAYFAREAPHIQNLTSLATDSLEKNLAQVRSFGNRFASKLTSLQLRLDTEHWDISRGGVPASIRREGGYDIITMMNVVNEVSEIRDIELISMLGELLSPNGAILMIEPSTKEPSRRALRFRDRLVEHGYFVYAPCTRTGGCPALREEDNWCHTDVPWSRPDFIRAIDDITGTLRLSLKSTYGVFLRQDLNLSDAYVGKRDFFSAGRVVSELFNEKGRARLWVCNERGRNHYILNKRDKSSANRDTLKVERYDVVQMEDVEVRENDVKIGEESLFHILSSADGCGNVDKVVDPDL